MPGTTTGHLFLEDCVCYGNAGREVVDYAAYGGAVRFAVGRYAENVAEGGHFGGWGGGLEGL